MERNGTMSGSKMRWAIGITGAVALLAGSVVPAAAQGWGPGGWRPGGHGGGWGHRPHYRDRGLNAGDVIGIAALIGAVAVIASSASKDRKQTRSAPDPRDYPDTRGSVEEEGYPPEADQSGYPGPAMSADQAADACAVAVRDKVEGEQGGYAEILDVAEPRASGQEGWAIDGRVERRAGVRGDSGDVRRFSCDVQGNRVAEVYISRDAG